MATAKTNPADITRMLHAWSAGDASVPDQLAPLIYPELKRIAKRHMAHEAAGATLETGAVLNEAWMRLAAWKEASFQNRAHFYGVASHIMRRVLVDQARSRHARKRNGAARPVSLDEVMVVAPERSRDLIALDDALNALAVKDARKAQVVVHRFFGGLTADESAEVLNVSVSTVQNDWEFAKGWLYRYLRSDRTGDA